METILNNELVQVLYHPDNAYLRLSWNGHCKSEVYKQVMEDILDWMLIKRINRFLLDQTSKIGNYFDDTYWTIECWYPKLIRVLGENGKLAVVLPNAPTETKPYFYISNQVFQNIEEAETWLCSEVI